MTIEFHGLFEVMSSVLEFGRQAKALEPAHLRQAVVEKLAATAGNMVKGVYLCITKTQNNVEDLYRLSLGRHVYFGYVVQEQMS